MFWPKCKYLRFCHILILCNHAFIFPKIEIDYCFTDIYAGAAVNVMSILNCNNYKKVLFNNAIKYKLFPGVLNALFVLLLLSLCYQNMFGVELVHIYKNCRLISVVHFVAKKFLCFIEGKPIIKLKIVFFFKIKRTKVSR